MQDLVAIAIVCEYLYDNPTIINYVFLIYKIISNYKFIMFITGT